MWNYQNVTFSGNNPFTGQLTEVYPLPLLINNFWIGIGIPPFIGGLFALLFTIIAVSLIVLNRGIDEPEKLIALISIIIVFGLSSMNFIPVEIAIALIILIAFYFASKVYMQIKGGE